jgi:NTP pyrophosphatase (non-canonical NTP hydrolase)
VSDLAATTARLNEIASELGDEALSDERAEELAREAADLVGEAANELERALRESASDRD